MKLKPTTLDVLKNFSSINQNLQVASGSVLRTSNTLKTIVAEAKLDDSFDKTFCVYDMHSFLGCYSMFSDAELTLNDTNLTFSSDSKSINYDYATETAITLPPAGDFTSKLPPVVATLNLSKVDINNITKSSAIMGHDTFTLDINSENITLRVMSIDGSMNGNEYIQQISDVGSPTPMNVIFKVENLKVLPDDYTVDIRSNGQAGIGVFTGKANNVTYYISPDIKSKF